MQLNQVLQRFKTLAETGLVYRVNAGASDAELQETEERLLVQLPTQVRSFWTAMDGVVVDDPAFEVLPLSDFTLDRGLLIFVTCNNEVQIAFDTSSKNVAGQWSIVNAGTGYRITYTMASFWSAHMWTWVAKRRPIWFDVHAAPNDSSSFYLPE